MKQYLTDHNTVAFRHFGVNREMAGKLVDSRRVGIYDHDDRDDLVSIRKFGWDEMLFPFDIQERSFRQDIFSLLYIYLCLMSTVTPSNDFVNV